MPRRRSEHTERVGEWLALLRVHRGWTQKELAARVGVAGDRTISNVETGATSIAPGNRPAWERAFGLPPNTLTDAYRRGRIPPDEPAGGTRGVVDMAGVPERYSNHPSVMEVLAASELSDSDKVRLLQIWVTQQTAFEQTFDTLRGRAAR
jgi:transcriptional regulator with XRE-family HTH domain